MSAQSSDSILIEALSAKFEGAWNAGTRPVLEDYLDGIPPEARPLLFAELLAIEITSRARLQEKYDKKDYLTRFPTFADIVNSHFSQSPVVEFPTVSFMASKGPSSRLGVYELMEPLGHGGMGSVFKAKHARLKKIVALKVVNAGKQSPEGMMRFQNEMEIVGRMNHPNIVQATDAGEFGGVHYLVMEYVHGLTLLKLTKLNKLLPIDVACFITRQAAAGLAHIHKHGLVHRDVKPSNIMITISGQVKILDLGLARLNDKLVAHEQLTREGDLLGTIDYMSPEQCEDAQSVDIRADIYGLGCTLFHMLSGRPPYHEEAYNTVIKKLMAHANAPVPRITQFRPEVPEELERIVMRMLSKAPTDRYASPAELVGVLEKFVQQPTAATCRQLAQSAYQTDGGGEVSLIDLTADSAHTTEATIDREEDNLAGSPVEEPLIKCPYPGLRAFSREESHLFFGREEHLEQLLDKLAKHRFLAVVGPSGCGKSSLVTAGLMPMFESGFIEDAGPHWREAVMRPGEAPFERLARSLLDERALGVERGSGELACGALEATLRRGPWGLADALNETGLPEGTNLVLLVDQFEEIFRYREICQSESRFGANDAQAFVDLLLTSTKPAAEADGRLDSVRVYVIITMRWDFLDDHFHFSGLTDALNRSVFFTPRLTRDQIRAAIIGPARSFDSEVEPVLVNRLLNDTATDPDQLPLIQHTLMRIWLHEVRQNAQGNAPPKLTLACYQQFGNAGLTLAKHADEKYLSGNARQHDIARKMFQWLCERSTGNRDTRRPITLGEVAKVADATPTEIISVVEKFRTRDCCLLMPPAGIALEESTILDISHECLIRKWNRLQTWLEEEAESAAYYKHLLSAARQAPREGRFIPYGDLDRALAWLDSAKPNETWAQRYGGDFPLVKKFLDDSQELREQSESGQRSKAAYDVFLWYHPDDRNSVRLIAERLRSAQLRPWFDEWDLPPGRTWEDELSRRMEQIGAAAIFVGPSARIKSQEMSLRGLMGAFQDRDCPVIPVILDGVKTDLPTFLRGANAVDFRLSQPDPMKTLIWGITGKRPD
jgi:serine/threonine protein kinase